MSDQVEIDVDVGDGKTVVEVSGTREAAVVVRSAAGERIYLPPEEFAQPTEANPYQAADSGMGGDSPYQGANPYQPSRAESPYQSAGPTQHREGLHATAAGFRVVHPEEVDEFTVLR